MTHRSTPTQACPLLADDLLLRALEDECDAVLQAWAEQNPVSLQDLDVLSYQLRQHVRRTLEQDCQLKRSLVSAKDLALHWNQCVRAEAERFLDQQSLVKGVRRLIEPQLPQIKLWVLVPMGCMVMVLLALYLH